LWTALREALELGQDALQLAAVEARLAIGAISPYVASGILIGALWVIISLILHGVLLSALVERGVQWSLALLGVAAVDLLLIAALSGYRRVLKGHMSFPVTRALLRGRP